MSTGVISYAAGSSRVVPFSPGPRIGRRNVGSFLRHCVCGPCAVNRGIINVRIGFGGRFCIPRAIRPMSSVLTRVSSVSGTVTGLRGRLKL